MVVEEIICEIEQQIDNIKYLQEHPDVAIATIMHETPEYCRGALTMLNYLKTYIEGRL
jgi:hypothetical protein